jgi:superfamily II RNA helicase
MKFKRLILDPFQIKAIQLLEQQRTVVVSAATGTGKTLIAEFIINACLKNGSVKVIYTAPIKALSNQKYQDFKQEYGENNVGMLTGDVVIHPQAPVLIMTTEIFRNMLLSQDPIINDVSYVVFDEIHYMNDPERGTVWEEAILLSPPSIPFLCLSATIPNADEFAAWLRTIKNHPVETVICSKRAVPLHHYYYDVHRGFIEREIGRQILQKGKKQQLKSASLSHVVLSLKDKLPAIVFSFSRRQCENEAESLLRRHSFITDETTRAQVIQICSKHFSTEVRGLQSTRTLVKALVNGIGFHHAGLLPQQRFAVEELFSLGVLKVLFTTETFAVGVNMPAKTVVLNGLRKYDGRRFRLITSKEYFQLAGRAGRRGIDTEGYVITLLADNETMMDYLRISERDTEPIQSQFNLSFNTILNMIDMYSQDEIDVLLRKNFYVFHRKHRQHRQVRMKASFTRKYKKLQIMQYITPQRQLTDKGVFAKKIYFEEVLISELFATPLYNQLSNTELLQLITGIVYERRPNDHFSFHDIAGNYRRLIKKIQQNPHLFKRVNKLSLKRMMAIVDVWSNGGSFTELLSLTNYHEGDIIRLFRRVIDMLQQIKRAADEEELQRRLIACQQRIDRGLVAIEFG